jgi:hypothetical protein
MPYIVTKDRPPIWRAVMALRKETGVGPGNLNYAITNLLLATDPKTYADYNALVGVLECVKLEFYRRAVSVYEEKKIDENGDVYPPTE